MSSTVRHRRSRPALAGLLALAALAGCAEAPVVEPPPPPVAVTVEVRATTSVNPDAAGRASPVALRVYPLKEDGAFLRGEFFAIWEQEAATLAAASVGRHDLALAPGGRGEVQFMLEPGVRFIGVVAAFRDFRSARWRATVAVPGQPGPDSNIRLLVTVDGLAVTAAWQ